MVSKSGEDQLLSAIHRLGESGRTGSHYRAVEQAFAELVGGQRSEDLRMPGQRQPDILISRADLPPTVIELKVFGQGFFKNNIGNRASELLATAVEMRRLFRGEILLTAVLILKLTPATSPIHDSIWPRMADRLLRADDGVGYDSVLFGFADSQLSWRYFAPRGVHQDMKESPRTTSEAIAMIRQEAVSPDTSRPTARRPLRRFLLVADEWRSGRGGLSTINRHLAIALAAAGHEATVLVPRVTEEDARVASAANVSIVAPPRIPGLSEKETLLLRPIFGEKGWEPDVIIGHGRALGPYAAAQQRQFFPGARRVHLVHTDAESLEAAKEEPGGTSTMTITEVRRNLEIDLARSADLVAGIGPLLTETIRDDLLGPGAPATVMEFMPGLRDLFDASTTRAPVKNRVLFIGRADDFHSKGIDLAAEALLKIMGEWPRGRSHPPVLVIRGVPDDAADDVKRKLDSIFDGRVSYTLRPYTDSETVLTHDLAQAKVLIMPSRHEGFGLAAFEAISAGVPVLISAESGVAQFLSESHLDTSPRSVISTRDSPTRLAVDRWADAIQAVLDDFDSARSEVISLRTSVGRLVSWDSVTERLLATLQGLP